MKKLLILMVLLTNVVQTMDGQLFRTRKAIRALKIAQKYINENRLEEAKAQLQQTIQIKDNFAVAYRELGKVHLLLEEYEEAIVAYEKSFALNPKLSRAAYYECGEAYFRLSKFDTAAIYFSQYEDLKGTRYTNAKKEKDLEKEHDVKAEIRRENYAFALEAVKNPVLEVPPSNLGPKINTPFNDYLPTISGDGLLLIYTTEKTYSPLETPTGENIYVSKKVEDEWTQSASFDNNLNTEVNEGMAKFASNERYMYFAGCQRDDSEGGCDIYEAQLRDNLLKEIRHLEGGVNSRYWDSQPSITCDGSMMFFSSNREGGLGGADIWVSYRKLNGTWSEAENLGPIINTPGDEESPFIAPDGLTLYFSSTGHPGMGDGDLFMTRLDMLSDGSWEWREPLNLGYPINTPFQEVGLFIKPDGKTALFASSRLGGAGGLDIYDFELPEDYQPYEMVLLEGRVTDEFSEEPLTLSLDVMRNGHKWELQTDEDGWYFICLPAKKAYAFQVNHLDYEYYMEAAFLAAQDNSIPFRFDIALIPKRRPTMPLAKNEPTQLTYSFYFDFDTYALNEKIRGQLKELVQKLETEEGWGVEVIGFTDDIGNRAYNQMLSEQRAKAIVEYLNNAGIEVKTIRQEGRGAIASTGTVDDEEEDKAKNRRVEVIIRK